VTGARFAMIYPNTAAPRQLQLHLRAHGPLIDIKYYRSAHSCLAGGSTMAKRHRWLL